MIGIGVVGLGYWGPNLVRNFAQLESAEVVALCDQNPACLDAAARRTPTAGAYASFDDLLANDRVDAVVIATPVTTHYELARAALEAGKHVLVEKPFTATSADAEDLIARAEHKGLVLMVDHTFVYTSAVQKMKELVDGGELGDLLYFDSVRVNLGMFQGDVSVVWDLAVHDLSIMDHLVDAEPTQIAVTSVAHVESQQPSMAYLTCTFDNDFVAHFHVNWLAPVKVRQIVICGRNKMLRFDDVEMSEKLKVYDRGVVVPDSAEAYQRKVGYRQGDMWAPRIDNVEALAVEAEHFIDCITSGSTPVTDGAAGLRIVRLLEAAERSVEAGGIPVDIGAESGGRT